MSEIYWESLNDGSHPLDVQIVCMKAVGSYYISYTLRDKGSILTIRKEELTGKYQPLENNCGVYLLIGDDKETGKKNVYVGQALTRENTNGMDRLREHASNQNERYFFKWTYAIVITTENNSFDSATVDTIEKMLITLFQQQSNINCLNGKVGTSGNISRARFENAYTAIKSLLQLKMFDLNLDKITDEVRLTEETIAEVLNQYREQIRAEIDDNRLTAEEKEILEYHRKAKVYDEFRSHIENAGNYVVNGRVYSMSEITNLVKSSEVTTPDNIAKDMIELLPKDVFNSKTKFLDIYCKSGVYICELIDKLMSSDYTLPINHEEEFKDLRVRLNHIVTNQLYAITGSLELNAVSCNAILNKIDEWNNKLNNGVNYALKKDLTLPNVLCIHNFKGNVKAYGAKLSDYVLDKFGMNLEESGEGYMKFDVVIGNPPYNSDIYIDFVNLGHELSKEYCCMITPAKWQAKTDGKPKGSKKPDKNETFRQNIVPRMSNIVFYPCTEDIFNIREVSGISYYIVDKYKKNSDEALVKIICERNNAIATDFEAHDETKLTLCNRNILNIIGKVGTLGEGFKQSLYVKNADHGEISIDDTLGEGFKQSLYVKNTDHGEISIQGALEFTGEQDRGDTTKYSEYVEVMQGEKVVGYRKINELFTTDRLDKWKVTTSIMAGNIYLDSDGKTLGVVPCNIIGPYQVPKGSYPVLRYFDTEMECKSFKSYYESKLVSFLFYFGACGTTLTKEFFRFIPCPNKFDHIFTDEELYKKYNLTDEEIAIIESVIKERK